jgi:phosphomannomutase
MIPWLLVTGLISESGQSLSSMVAERVAAYPCSGEINRSVEDAGEVLSRVGYRYRAEAVLEEDVDGLSMDMGQWRFNLRMSNTEPVVRLNVESRGDRALMEEKTRDLLALIEG